MDPLTGELLGGPLDGGVVLIHPAPFIEVGVEGENGNVHVYECQPTQPARMVYVRTERARANPLVGGLDQVCPH